MAEPDYTAWLAAIRAWDAAHPAPPPYPVTPGVAAHAAARAAAVTAIAARYAPPPPTPAGPTPAQAEVPRLYAAQSAEVDAWDAAHPTPRSAPGTPDYVTWAALRERTLLAITARYADALAEVDRQATGVDVRNPMNDPAVERVNETWRLFGFPHALPFPEDAADDVPAWLDDHPTVIGARHAARGLRYWLDRPLTPSELRYFFRPVELEPFVGWREMSPLLLPSVRRFAVPFLTPEQAIGLGLRYVEVVEINRWTDAPLTGGNVLSPGLPAGWEIHWWDFAFGWPPGWETRSWPTSGEGFQQLVLAQFPSATPEVAAAGRPGVGPTTFVATPKDLPAGWLDHPWDFTFGWEMRVEVPPATPEQARAAGKRFIASPKEHHDLALQIGYLNTLDAAFGYPTGLALGTTTLHVRPEDDAGMTGGLIHMPTWAANLVVDATLATAAVATGGFALPAVAAFHAVEAAGAAAGEETVGIRSDWAAVGTQLGAAAVAFVPGVGAVASPIVRAVGTATEMAARGDLAHAGAVLAETAAAVAVPEVGGTLAAAGGALVQAADVQDALRRSELAADRRRAAEDALQAHAHAVVQAVATADHPAVVHAAAGTLATLAAGVAAQLPSAPPPPRWYDPLIRWSELERGR